MVRDAELSDGGETMMAVATSRSDLHRFLIDLLDDPRGDMAVEIKDWLDLADKIVAGDFARELLALANHGGRTVLFGFADEATGWRASGACAYAADVYSQDRSTTSARSTPIPASTARSTD
jgi:hypothetical protein